MIGTEHISPTTPPDPPRTWVAPFPDLTPDDPEELLYAAWQVIANVGLHRGAWESQHPEWVAAAKRWRDAWHQRLADRPHWQPTPEGQDPA